MRKICVITGTRAEYGLLSRLMKMILDDADTQLQIVATNMHLSPKFGNTYQEIENDGFSIDYKVPIIDEAAPDTAATTAKSMAQAITGFADAYDSLHPDLIVILGDRYEMMAAAAAALLFRIPIAHLYGGEITEGAYDDAIRHCITKMSHLHFTSTEQYRKRVIQLGEQPERVFYVGAIGVENAKLVPLMGKKEIEGNLGFKLDNNTILATYHPVTNDVNKVDDFFQALDETKDLRILFTMPNSDTGGQIIANKINQFAMQHPDRCVAFKSLGMKRYLSVLQYVSAVIGNSSSGLVEVPSFHIPTLNIGSRQQGRISGASVIHCASDYNSIKKGLEEIFTPEIRERAKNASNPYEKPGTALNIFKVIKDYPLGNITLKHFYDI